MKTKTLLGLSMAAAAILATSCSEEPTYVGKKTFTVTETVLTLTEGDSRDIHYAAYPQQTPSWTLTNDSVADIEATDDTTLTVTGLTAGQTDVTLVCHDIRRTLSITVRPFTIPVTGVKVTPDKATVHTGDTLRLKASVLPADASIAAVAWSSTDTSVATIDSTGLARTLKAGMCTLMATTADGGKTAGCKLTVSDRTYAVDSVTLDSYWKDMQTGDTCTLAATIWPSNATNKKVSWSSRDTAIATVSKKGLVTALKAGTTTVTVATADGNRKAACTVTVSDRHIAVTGISLDRKEMSLERGGTGELKATVTPSNATDGTVIWASSDKTVATVADGLVSALKAGTTTIKATTRDGNKVASCTVTVKVSAVSITLDRKTLSMTQGETRKLAATVKPDDASERTVTWTSSDAEVASVDTAGTVTALLGGTATIKARTANGLEAACTVTVTNLPDALLSVVLLDASGNECTEGVFRPTKVERTTSMKARLTVRRNGRTETYTGNEGDYASSDIATFEWKAENTGTTEAMTIEGNHATALLTAYHNGKTKITCTAEGNAGGIQGSVSATANMETVFRDKTITSLTVTRMEGSPELLSYKGTSLTAAFTAKAVYADNTTEDVTDKCTWTASTNNGECSMSTSQAGTMTISSLGSITDGQGTVHKDCAGGAFTAKAAYDGMTAEAQVQANPSFQQMQVYLSPDKLTCTTKEQLTFTVVCATYGGKTCTGEKCNFGDNSEFSYMTACYKSTGAIAGQAAINGKDAATGTIRITGTGEYVIRTTVTDTLTGETLTYDRNIKVTQ